MKFYIVALSLPRRGYYLTLHKHTTPEVCKWAPSDRDSLLRIRRTIEQLYERGPAGLPLTRADLTALYDEGLTAKEASRSVLPYYLACTSENKKRLVYPNATENDIEVVGPAGTHDEPYGVRLVAISKGAPTLHPEDWVLKEVSSRRGSPFTEEEFQTLEGRSDRILIDVLATASIPCTKEGDFEIVVVPAEADVKLSRAGNGEFVREIARTWS